MNNQDFSHKALKLDFDFNLQIGHNTKAIRVDYIKIFSKYPDFRNFYYQWLDCNDISYNHTNEINELSNYSNDRFIDELGYLVLKENTDCNKIFINIARCDGNENEIYDKVFDIVRNNLLNYLKKSIFPDMGSCESLEGFCWENDYSIRNYIQNRPGMPFKMSDCMSEDLLDLIDLNTGIDFRKIEIEKWL